MFMTIYSRGYLVAGSIWMMLVVAALSSAQASASDQMPDPIAATAQWLNSPPLTSEMLRGKVVLVEFWTYTCINCLHALPYVKA